MSSLVSGYKLPSNRFLEIHRGDDVSSNPRVGWDNVGKMYCLHKRYTLGDVQLNNEDYSSWEEVREEVSSEGDVVLPLYLLDHSGLKMSTSSFECRWDSGPVGYIVATKETIIKEYGVYNEFNCDLVRKVLEGEVKIYSQYLEGEVYGFEIVSYKTCDKCGHTEEDTEDSCWGFYGEDIKENGILDHLQIEDKEYILKNYYKDKE